MMTNKYFYCCYRCCYLVEWNISKTTIKPIDTTISQIYPMCWFILIFFGVIDYDIDIDFDIDFNFDAIITSS